MPGGCLQHCHLSVFCVVAQSCIPYLVTVRSMCVQGYGNFRSPDGSHYQGGWSANLKHGLGKKTYANGDFYEGLWRYGKAEGPGRYVQWETSGATDRVLSVAAG